MHRRCQADRAEIRSVKESKKVRESLFLPRTKNGNQTLRVSQTTDHKLMARLFECRQMVQRSLLIRRGALDGVDHDHGVEVIQHSTIPLRCFLPGTLQFLVSRRILFLPSGLLRLDFLGGSTRKAPGPLTGGNLADHVGETTPCGRDAAGTDRHLHRARRQVRGMAELQLAVRVEHRLDRLFFQFHSGSSSPFTIAQRGDAGHDQLSVFPQQQFRRVVPAQPD